MKKISCFIITIMLLMSSGAFAQDRFFVNEFKIYDTTSERHKGSNRTKIRDRRLTIGIDSLGVVFDAWDGECLVSLSLPRKLLRNAQLYEVGERNGQPFMRYGNSNLRFQMYINKRGIFEFDAIFPRNTGRHQVPMKIDSKNVRFLFQPAPTDAEAVEELKTFDLLRMDPLIPKVVKDSFPTTIDETKLWMMPEKYHNTYALYHITKRHNYTDSLGVQNNFSTGKIGQYEALLAWSADGDTVSAYMEIVGDSIMYIGVDSTWKANAVHPVTIDPPFGYNTAGSSTTNRGDASYAYFHADEIYTASTNDEIQEYYFYGHNSWSGTENLELAVYSMSGGTPDARLHASETIVVNSATAQWWSITGLSHSMTGSTDYGCGIGFPTTTTRVYYDRDIPTSHSYNDATTGVLPSTWTNATGSDFLVSVYAVYANVGGGGSDPSTRRNKILRSRN